MDCERLKENIFNLTSKNGSQELISLLQYMKRTDIQNPDITVKDERILELDDIVQEVKASEEWEAVKMSILEIGIEKGCQWQKLQICWKKRSLLSYRL